jgi:hypothetical protein
VGVLRLLRKRPRSAPAPNARLERTYWATHREIERLLAEQPKRAA